MPAIEGVEQNSVEWLVARIGCATASRVKDIVGRKQPTAAQKKAGEPGDYRQAHYDYMMELVAERLSGRAVDHYVSPAMEFGIETEPLAVAAYEVETGNAADPGGIWLHPTINWFAASPDRVLGEYGILEAKCPNTTTHLEYLCDGVVPLDYQPQILAQLSCSERKWADFVSFDPRLPSDLQLFVRRYERNDEHVRIMEEEVIKFLAEVDAKVAQIKKSGRK
jgi:putative phage-type endonuclease